MAAPQSRMHEVIDELRWLREEILFNLALATVDVAERWCELEPRFVEAERHLHQSTHQATAAAEELVVAFRGFLSLLKPAPRLELPAASQPHKRPRHH